MAFIIRPAGAADLTNAQLVEETALPQTMSEIAPGDYEVGRVEWGPTGTVTDPGGGYGPELLVDPGFDNPASMGNGNGWAVSDSSLTVDNAVSNSVEVTSNYRADVTGLESIFIEIFSEGMSGAVAARARYTVRFYNGSNGLISQIRLPNGQSSVNHGVGAETVTDTVAVPADAVAAGIVFQRRDADLVGSWSGHSIRAVL